MEIGEVELRCGACGNGRLGNPFMPGTYIDSWRHRSAIPPREAPPPPPGSPLGDELRRTGTVVRSRKGEWRYNDNRRPNRPRVYHDTGPDGVEYARWRCSWRGCGATPKRAFDRLAKELERWIADHPDRVLSYLIR